jgi:hypothetical protein
MVNIGFRIEKAARQAARPVFILCILCALVGLLTVNPLLTLCGFIIPPVLTLLLWRAGEPPVLLFAVGYQWVQVFVPVLNADMLGVHVGGNKNFPGLEFAAWLGLLSIIVLAIGMRFGVRGSKYLTNNDALNEWSSQLDVKQVMVCYLTSYVVAYLSFSLTAIFPGVEQVAVTLSYASTMMLFLIFWAALRYKRFRLIGYFTFFLEILLGFGGFFADFKGVIYLFFVIYLGRPQRSVSLVGPRSIVLVVFVLFLGSTWQAIKVDYRAYLNQGTKTQTVLVDVSERVNYLVDAAEALQWKNLTKGLESIAGRIGYLEFFARSTTRVPRNIPYQDGRLWGEAISHVLRPRIFFPDKEAISDSKRTNEFTGLRVASAGEGASISIGYIGESYIDYGPVLMFAPIMLLGFFWGRSYVWLVSLSPVPVLGLAVATVHILVGATLFEKSNIKIVGGSLMLLLVYVPLIKFGGKTIWFFLCNHGRPRDTSVRPRSSRMVDEN